MKTLSVVPTNPNVVVVSCQYKKGIFGGGRWKIKLATRKSSSTATTDVIGPSITKTTGLMVNGERTDLNYYWD
jgi:hypothetical protein